MTSRLAAAMIAFLGALLISGCLNMEKKEYRFKFNPDGSGSGTIRFVNLVSTDEDEKDVSFKDFATLVTDYMEGDKFDSENAGLHATAKRLKEENGVLIAEVDFTFPAPDSAGFLVFNSNGCSMLMNFVKSQNGSETVTESNGRIVEGVTDSPFVVWDGGTKDCSFKTTVMSDTSGARSLIAHYRNWKKK